MRILASTVGLLVLVSLALGMRVSRPLMPPVFYAKISASMREGDVMSGPAWRGGGMLALDMKRGISRTHLSLQALQGQEFKTIHTLDRLDMNATFTMTAGQECTKEAATGKLNNMWDWVENAKLAGVSSYLGAALQNWEFTDGSTHFKLSVKEGTSEPVYFSKRHIVGDSVQELTMTFLSWNVESPPDWLIFVPNACLNTDAHVSPALGDTSKVVYFANWQWDCADPNCASTVPSGTLQPGYECAEFAARSLAYGGYIPGLTTGQEAQGSYYSYGYNGNTYDLCLVSSFSDALAAIGFTKLTPTASSVNAGVAALGNGGDGAWSHAVIGVSAQTVDAHNYAEQNIAITWELGNGIDACWGPPGTPSSTSSGSSGSSSSGSSSSYTGATMVMKEEPSLDHAIYDVKKSSNVGVIKTDPLKQESIYKNNIENMPEVSDLLLKENFHVREEKATKKFFA